MAAGNDSDAIALLLREIPNDDKAEAILHSAKFHDLQKQIRLGLIDYERQSVSLSQIRYGITETLRALEGEQSLSVLVAGTGRYDLPQPVLEMAKAIGSELASQEMQLVCGGWQGVDYVVAEHFAQRLLAQHKPLSDYLIQVVPEHSPPAFKGIKDVAVSTENQEFVSTGTVLNVKQGKQEWLEAIRYADVVVLIGGEGGTYETFAYAHQENRPIFPLPTTGGDAARAYQQILSRWDYWQQSSLKGITKAEFETLDKPIQTPADAQYLVNKLLEMILKLT